MKSISFNLALLLTFLVYHSSAQEVEKPMFEIKPYGFIGYNIYLDTYKSYDSRDGELYFFPLKPQLDSNNRDINARTMFEMTSVTSRLGTRIAGPDFFRAKTTGLFEMDFFGTKQDFIQQLRLRHAMVTLQWERSELLIGNYWHPLILNEMIPGVVSFGGAAPFHSLNRSAQVRYTYHFSPVFRLTGAAIVHGYHRSKGPNDAQRYSGKPDVHAQVSVGNRKDFIAGFSAGYKWLTPRLVTDSLFKTSKTIGSYDVHAFIMVKPGSMSFKLESIYGQNLTFLNMIGGYGMVTGSNNKEGDYNYTNLNTVTVWGDVQQNTGNWSVGVFIGYQKLLGADDNYTSLKDYNFYDDLSHIFRFSPRIIYKADALSLAFEYILTSSVYGKSWDERKRVKETIDPVSNNRLLINLSYRF